MKKFLLPIMTFAMIMLPAAANAAQCRDSATGKFAKCGAPGAVPASQYVAKGKSTKTAGKTMAPATAGASNAGTKPGMMSMFKPKAKPTASTMAMPMAKTARCKSTTGKFVKCGTPGAKPA